ncbi:MAG: hypothetical protein IIZ80_07555 [Erysipelotrichaceae bacterium]|nr:hypothetical protein [Erysipelotrichaceae bacterium]
MKNSLMSRFVRVLIVFFMFILVINSFLLVREIKREVNFQNRSYGLSVFNDWFENGEYYKIYLHTLKNELVEEKPYVDVSEFEAFGRLYNAYLKAKMYPDNQEYRNQIKIEKTNIKLKKILNVVTLLEEDLEQ